MRRRYTVEIYGDEARVLSSATIQLQLAEVLWMSRQDNGGEVGTVQVTYEGRSE